MNCSTTFCPKDILIAGADDFMSKYLYKAMADYQQSLGGDTEARVWMLGTVPEAGMKVSLDAERFVLPCEMQVVVYCDATDIDMPGFDTEIALKRVDNLLSSLESESPSSFIYISSVAVYGNTQGDNIDETMECNPVTCYGKAKLSVESRLREWCDARDVGLTVLRAAMVVGTGMGGPLRRLVNRIYRGTYHHIADNSARVSVVHATNLADYAVRGISVHGTYNITDGNNPARHDLAEAFAWRLDHKRIYTLSLSKAKILARIGDYIPVTGFTSSSLAQELSTSIYDNALAVASFDVTPVAVVDYLRNHVYDESSL